MFLRIYLVWRWFIFHSFLQYSNMEASYVVKDWKTLKLLQKVASKSSARALLAIKFAMKLHPKQILVSLYWILILCVTYIVRLGDGPARREHRHVFHHVGADVCQSNATYYHTSSYILYHIITFFDVFDHVGEDVCQSNVSRRRLVTTHISNSRGVSQVIQEV